MKKKIFSGLFYVALLGAGVFVFLGTKQPKEAKRCEWWFSRNEEGNVPRAAEKSAVLRRYDAYYVGDTSQKVIYLTFDEGYENGCSAEILDTLKENDVHAAFFVTGSFLRKAPELAVRMVEEGHVVGNHTVSHPDMTGLSEEEFTQELLGCAQAFRKITGQDMDPFFRPPEGIYSIQTLKKAKELGYKTIFWSLAHRDWLPDDQPTAEEACHHILTYSHNGCITLLHALSTANAEALDGSIKALKAEGYEFKSLYELP